MTTNSSNRKHFKDDGYVFLGVLVLLAVSAVIVAASLSLTSTDTRTTLAQRVRSENYYLAEQSLNSALSWLRQNSTSLALMFSRSNFYQNFDRANHSVGDNEGTTFSIPTAIRMAGTTNSVFLANDSTLGTNSFPASTIDAVTGATFTPQQSFSAADFGTSMVRITLVDAIARDPVKDFGDPDDGNPAPETDFSPVYRIDSMQGVDSGAHVFGYVVGSLVTDYGVGFFGKELVDFQQACDSYISNNGAYSSSVKRANCSVGSEKIIQIHQNEAIYGKATASGNFNNASPYGGKVCADFEPNCPNPGQTCSGSDCPMIGLPTYMPWEHYCPSNQGDLVVERNSTFSSLTVDGNLPSQKCWNKITINPSQTLTLRTTTIPYFIDTFDIANNAKLNFSPDPATATINLYVRKFVGDKFNGNQLFNVNNKPYQLRIHYLGSDALEMNGTAAINAFLVAPYVSVTISGNFTYQGGVKALKLYATGSGNLHYDESGDVATISDVTHRLRNVSEKYR